MDHITIHLLLRHQIKGDAMNYLNELYSNARDGYISTWCKSSGYIKWFSLSELETAQNYMDEVAASDDVYFCWSLQKEQVAGRGNAHNAIAIPGFFLDVDLKSSESGVHSKNELLPESVDDFLTLLDEVGFPSPTAIRNSGNGAYLDWVFQEPLRIDDANRNDIAKLSKRFQAAFIAAAKSKDWALDNVGDLARVTRSPGTLNHKTTPPKNVSLVAFNPQLRIGIAELKEAIDRLERSVLPMSAGNRSNRELASNTEALTDNPRADVHGISAGCGWMRDLIERRAKLTEPEWYAAAGILGRCNNGTELFHRFSQADPRYDEGETAKKLDHAMKAGPRLCSTIAAEFQNEACENCAFRHSGLKTPFNLKAISPQIAEVAAGHVFNLSTHSYIELSTMTAFSEKTFNNKFKPLYPKKSPHLELISKDTTMRVLGTDYRPGEANLFLPEGSEWLLNVWRPADIVPAIGDASIIKRHIEHVFPDEVARNHFLDALAFHMQNPFEKIRHVMLIIGKQGLGKSFFNSLLMKLCGEKNVYLAESTDLTSGWTASMANREVVVLEELDTSERRVLVSTQN
jgi:hypothetical protein